MLALDASSIIHGWDNYPKKQFPPLWNWLAQEIQQQQVGISDVALGEVERASPDCAEFLKDSEIARFPVTSPILQRAVEIKGLLGIVNEVYGSGVNENDLLIISTALVHELTLVSDEHPQSDVPKENRNLKIPRVCSLPQVRVECITFLEMIRRSGEVFE